MNVFNYNTLTK
jgi:hypothetical protein